MQSMILQLAEHPSLQDGICRSEVLPGLWLASDAVLQAIWPASWQSSSRDLQFRTRAFVAGLEGR